MIQKASGAPTAPLPSTETVIGHVTSALINRVIVPLETTIGRDLEWTLEKLTGHAVFNAYSMPPAPVAFELPIVFITGLFMRPSSYDAAANHFACGGKQRTIAVYNCADGQFHLKRPD